MYFLRLMYPYFSEIMQPSASNAQDFLLQDIESARDTAGVLQIVGTHHKIMNSRHVMQSLTCIFDLNKSRKLVLNLMY
jgi:isopenicillin N synthase-like dioxygenase